MWPFKRSKRGYYCPAGHLIKNTPRINADNMYAYECTTCKAFHITKNVKFNCDGRHMSIAIYGHSGDFAKKCLDCGEEIL